MLVLTNGELAIFIGIRSFSFSFFYKNKNSVRVFASPTQPFSTKKPAVEAVEYGKSKVNYSCPRFPVDNGMYESSMTDGGWCMNGGRRTARRRNGQIGVFLFLFFPFSPFCFFSFWLYS